MCLCFVCISSLLTYQTITFLTFFFLTEVPEAVIQKRSPTTDQKLSDRASEYALIQYLSTLVKKKNVIETFDFDFVEFLLENGANINNCNVIGQSPFHIVAKYWNIDVARFLFDHGRFIDWYRSWSTFTNYSNSRVLMHTSLYLSPAFHIQSVNPVVIGIKFSKKSCRR